MVFLSILATIAIMFCHFHFLTMHTPLGHLKTQNRNNLHLNPNSPKDP